MAVGVLGALAPLLYLGYKRTQAKSQRVEKLQGSMMLLSNSYIVTEDFVQSVQDNIELLEYPAPFRNFLTYVSLIDGNIKTGLRRMENQVDHPYFSQWVDVLLMAQDDRRMFEELAEEKPNHFAVRQYKKYKLAAGKTAKKIGRASCRERV